MPFFSLNPVGERRFNKTVIIAIISMIAALLSIFSSNNNNAATSTTSTSSPIVFEKSAIQINKQKFTIEIASNYQQMAQGLMNRREMPADHGMLFVYQKPQQASMWMKNTFLSLDMLFIDEKGRIVQIIPSTTPLSEDNISSKIPVKAVLELLAGTCHKKRIAVGDIVRHEIFATNQ